MSAYVHVVLQHYIVWARDMPQTPCHARQVMPGRVSMHADTCSGGLQLMILQLMIMVNSWPVDRDRQRRTMPEMALTCASAPVDPLIHRPRGPRDVDPTQVRGTPRSPLPGRCRCSLQAAVRG